MKDIDGDVWLSACSGGGGALALSVRNVSVIQYMKDLRRGDARQSLFVVCVSMCAYLCARVCRVSVIYMKNLWRGDAHQSLFVVGVCMCACVRRVSVIQNMKNLWRGDAHNFFFASHNFFFVVGVCICACVRTVSVCHPVHEEPVAR
jgi:hypothetical protein